MRPTLPRIATVLFISGLCSLVYQVAWLRLLRLVFGVSTASTAVVLAIFMGGLGLGGLVLGRRVERVRNPLLFYAGLEIGIAVTAAASPLLIGLVRQLYLGLGGVTAMGLVGATTLRILLAVLVLGVPTTLMGGTLPAVALAMQRDADRGRRRVAVLYGVNTAGAVAGALITTFVLLELVGIRCSLWLAAGLNLLLALVVLGMSRLPATTAAQDAPGGAADAGAAPEPQPVAAPLVLVTAGVAGFLFFLMELVWYRMLGPVLGGSSYTFGLILAVALAGIAAGGALYGRGAESRRPSLEALAATCLVEGICLALPYAAGDDLALLAAILRPLDALGFAGLVLGWTVLVVVVVLPAAIVAGYQFPLMVALLGSGRQRVASQVGLAYAWNTWGAILGSLAGGFGLMPLLTAPGLWRWSVLLLVLVGLVLAAVAWWVRERGLPRLVAAAGAALVGLVLCLAYGPSAFWRHVPVGAGRIDVNFHDPNKLRNARHSIRRALVREAEGIESSVALMSVEELALYVNGKSDGSAVGDAPTTVMLGLVGGMLHPQPRSALVIGLGTGATAGWLARIESLGRVDVIELEPAVGELAALFAPISFDVLTNPRVHLHVGDGREHVLTSAERWDLIVSEPSNPYRAGVADLFSQDFYQAVAPRLRPGGIFVQWLQGYEIDAELMRIAYSTLGSVFPHLETWQVNTNDLLLVASREPLVHDFDRIRREVRREPYRSALRWVWRVEGIEGFYSGFVAGNPLAERLAVVAEHRVSSDDRPRIEFGFARNVGRTGLLPVGRLQELSRRLGAERPPARGAPPDWDKVLEARQIRTLSNSYTEVPPPAVPPPQQTRRAARAAYARGAFASAARLWAAQGEEPVMPFDHLLVAEALSDQGDVEAERHLELLRELAPTEAAFLTARLRLRQGAGDEAAAHLVAAVERMQGDPWAFRPLVRRGLELIGGVVAAAPQHGERLFAALARPFAVRYLEEVRLTLRVQLVRSLPAAEHCVAAFAPFEPHVAWNE
ncbi:MAG: spermidine synthase, partial [bacterium]|nr:spermidine synthase [bacterium]